MKKLGIYVHIPFCIQKCKYCDFASFVKDTDVQDKYTDYIVKEINSFKNKANNYIVNSIFFGGGTPSVLSSVNMHRIITAIKANFYLTDDAEISLECNPKTASFTKLKNYIKMGFNRISIGVQSLDDKLLKTIGRIHTSKDFLECYTMVKLAGFKNINYDLMFALPEQSIKSFKETVDNLVKLKPEHISCYSLILEENTPLYEEKDSYKFADEDENREMYEYAKKVFEDNGYEQYEISNFAKKGYECIHNLKYWEMKDYIGFGSSASSFFEEKRHTNPDNLNEYFELIENYKYPFDDIEKEEKKDMMSEFMFLGLRKIKGINDKDFKELFNESFFDIYKKEIEKHINNGLLIKEDDNIRLSSKGLDLANFVMSDFV